MKRLSTHRYCIRVALVLLALWTAMMLFSCTIPLPPDPYQYTEDAKNFNLKLELYQIRQLYEAAGEGEEAFNATLAELDPQAKCTRDQFLTAYDTFSKDRKSVV